MQSILFTPVMTHDDSCTKRIYPLDYLDLAGIFCFYCLSVVLHIRYLYLYIILRQSDKCLTFVATVDSTQLALLVTYDDSFRHQLSLTIL